MVFKNLAMYVDIYWQSIGNLKMVLFQDSMYEKTQKYTL